MTETRLDDFKFRMQLTALAILQFIFISCAPFGLVKGDLADM
eukprot:CAMPEP_0179407680 /NCGR_PEP_ID=MMETSP0799-20121207/1651_1 /TAXON_ID=46947 /ORGANISM="Geminigera cryophila, Strain CCMP2564" /LENGTH=41 /DNA_ID= /DNA_START= /DNA_END= /DNA_ORIENTATION=